MILAAQIDTLKKHGERSAEMINSDESLKYLFPAGHIQDQIAIICSYHDREIKELEELEEVIKLDIRYSHLFKNYQKIEIHQKFLAATKNKN